MDFTPLPLSLNCMPLLILGLLQNKAFPLCPLHLKPRPSITKLKENETNLEFPNSRNQHLIFSYFFLNQFGCLQKANCSMCLSWLRPEQNWRRIEYSRNTAWWSTPSRAHKVARFSGSIWTESKVVVDCAVWGWCEMEDSWYTHLPHQGGFLTLSQSLWFHFYWT